MINKEKAKDFMLFILLGNYESRNILENQLVQLYQYSGLDKGYSGKHSPMYFFVKDSMSLLYRERYEDWLSLFKQELLQDENYELMHYLEI